jgi:hypothetical protein
MTLRKTNQNSIAELIGPGRLSISKEYDEAQSSREFNSEKAFRKLNPDLLTNHSEELPNHPLQFKSDMEHPGCCTLVGTLSEPLLQEFSSDFAEELKAYYSMKRPPPLIKHPSLPFALAGRHSGSTSSTWVLSESSQGTMIQHRRVMGLLFKMLISWTYEFLEQTLNRFDIPIFAYRIHQRRFLEWLQQLIFPSCASSTDKKHMRIFQLIQPPCPTWEKDFSDRSLGLTQIHLINFFSTNQDNTELAKVTAAYLVKTYLANKESGSS